MSFSAIFSSRAQKEIQSSWEWYEERQAGLGDRFKTEVINKVKSIKKDPTRYPFKFKSYRETLVANFPVLLIYKVNTRKKLIKIDSVFHTARNPKKKY